MTSLLSNRRQTFLLLGLLLLSLLSAARIAEKMLDPAFGGLDFHAYWYSGHALRQGENPYRFVLDRQALDLPIVYLDGNVTDQPPVAQPGFPRLATNTAPVYLPLAASAFLPWPTAKWIWFLINSGLMLLAPFLVLRLFPHGRQFTPLQTALVFLIFFGLTSTRVTAWIGQTTFLIFDLMLASLILRQTRPFWSGILLGFALSKYSLALGAPLMLLWEKRRTNLIILLVAALVQLVGLLLLSSVAGDTPLALLGDYAAVLRFFADSARGYQIAILFPEGSILGIIAPLVLTVVVFGFLIWQRLKRPWPPGTMALAGYEVFTILILWTLLVAYHGIYDLAVAILFVPLALLVESEPQKWHLNPTKRLWFLGLGAAGIGLLMLPGTILSAVLPPALADSWLALFDRALVLAIVLLLGLAMWLLAQPHLSRSEVA